MNFLKKNKYFFLGLSVLAWVIFINLFPKGYVFGGGDTNQLIEARDSFASLFWNWQGRASFFYGIFYLLSLIGFSNSLQLSFYLGFIIFGSYLSFWLFSKLIFPKADDLPRSLISLFYALNLYTLFLFTGNWGYSYFPSLYVFIPLLIGLFIKFLQEKENSYGIWFCLFLFLGSSGFGNPAFALSFALFLSFIVTFLLLSKSIRFDNRVVGKIFLIIIFSFLISASWIFPLAPQMKSGVEGLTSSNVIDYETIIRTLANPISDTIGLMQNSDSNFPYNFYYKNFSFLKNFFILLAFLPIILVASGLFFTKKKKTLLFGILGVFLVFIVFITKVRPPFEILNYYIYHIWGFSVLRGYDKTAIYLPFILSFLLLFAISSVRIKKYFYFLIILALLAPLPFYIGKLQQTAGYRVNSKNDYRQAKMSFLLKIPQEYYQIQKTLNSDPERSQIGILPATHNDGSGIVYYPSWELYGADITQFLYSKRFISQNINYFPNWNLAQNLEDENSTEEPWIVEALGMMNSKYILFHKDAPDDDVAKSLPKMRVLENQGVIKNLEENKYLILYKISSAYFLPYLSWQTGNPEIQGNLISFERNYPKVKDNSFGADFQEINPKKFIINLKDQRNSKNLILAETYDPLWKAYYELPTGKEIEIKDHFKARGYANGWNINAPENTTQIIVEYYPIRLMWKGIWISGLTVLFLIIYLLRPFISSLFLKLSLKLRLRK